MRKAALKEKRKEITSEKHKLNDELKKNSKLQRTLPGSQEDIAQGYDQS